MREIRSFDVSELRVVTEDGGGQTLKGHAAVFDQLSLDLGGFREKIAPGAFAGTIQADDIRALWNHDTNQVLGRNRAGTLQLFEDERGLGVRIQPPDTQWARDRMVTIGRGDVSQMSFMFDTITDSWQIVEGENIRTLHAVKLWEVSPVTFPAYPQTDIGVRTPLLSALSQLRGEDAFPVADMARLMVRAEHRLPLTAVELERLRSWTRWIQGEVADMAAEMCGRESHLDHLRNRLEIALRT